MVNRLSRLLSIGCFFVFLFGQARAADRPNIVVVMTDDQGYGEFSCNGNPITNTPNIDALAAQAIRLTDFHVAPMCTPTRGQLMTGVDAFRNRASNVSSGRTLLKADMKTLADVFQQAGYRTGLFGKWHLGDNYPYRPSDRGFEETLWFPSSHINSVPDFWDNDYFDDTYIHNDRRQKYEGGYCTDVFFREANRWMQQDDQRPFFTYIALNAAHWPWFVPDKYRAGIRDAIDANPDVVRHLKQQKVDDLVSFLAMGANIDENVGKLDEFLRDSGLFENTIVVFLTDNGSTMGHDYFNAGMRGKKTQLWEGGHRVPCFIRWPAGPEAVSQPRAISQLTQVQDLMPTLTDMAGIANVPQQLDGNSLVPLFAGETQAFDDRMLVINYSRMPMFKVKYTDGNPAIPSRDGAGVLWKHWRFLENRELYNVAEDPHQEHDIAADHPAVVAKLRNHLQQWWDSVEDTVNVPERVVIGNDSENPMMLTACEWLDVFVDQQIQVRYGTKNNGVWHLSVDRAGDYELELRRWPRESGLKLDASLPIAKVTDGTFPAGKAFPIKAARVELESPGVQHSLTLEPEADQESFITTVPLSNGPIEMKATFLDSNGDEIAGAYYVYVHRK